MQIRIVKLDASGKEDFFRLHCDQNSAGGCFCTAWWVPTWEEWSDRTPEQNRELRRQLFSNNQFDGYLLYDGTEPIGWCQCCPRDAIPKIRQTYNLVPDPRIWAVSCFFILARYREIGLAQHFLDKIIEDLISRDVTHIQGFPKRGKNLQADDLWTGPESIFVKAGFRLEQDDECHPVYGLHLGTKDGI
jgi:hypothetical protein